MDTKPLRDLAQSLASDSEALNDYANAVDVENVQDQEAVSKLQGLLEEEIRKGDVLEEDLRKATSGWSAASQTIVRLEKEKSALQIENDTLKRLLAEAEGNDIPSDDNPIPPAPPIQVSPDITIDLEGFGSFRPGLTGEEWNGRGRGTEERYRGQFGEISPVLDLYDAGHYRVTIERCQSTLKVDAPVITTRLTIKEGSKVVHSAPLRLHHHQRPTKVFNRNESHESHTDYLPSFNLNSMADSALIPRYDSSTSISESELVMMDEGRGGWIRWAPEAAYDPISEEYDLIRMSWLGGAGPILNEAAMFMPHQVAFLLSKDPRAWKRVLRTADISGNFAIHYRNPSTGRMIRAEETANLLQLNVTERFTLKLANGTNQPIPDTAHQHNLTALAFLLTRERYYLEEMESWHGFNVMGRPKGEARLSGILWSDQVRHSVWAYRTLYHLYRCCLAAGQDSDSDYYGEMLERNLQWFYGEFVLPTSPSYRPSGALHVTPYRYAPMLQYITMEPKPPYVATWNEFVMSYLLSELSRAGFTIASPCRDHVLKIAEGIWKHAPSKYLVGWGNVAYPSHDWAVNERVNFAGLPNASNLTTFLAPPLTPEYNAWFRSAVVAAVNAQKSWATEALQWCDREMSKWKGGISLAWRVRPE